MACSNDGGNSSDTKLAPAMATANTAAVTAATDSITLPFCSPFIHLISAANCVIILPTPYNFPTIRVINAWNAAPDFSPVSKTSSSVSG